MRPGSPRRWIRHLRKMIRFWLKNSLKDANLQSEYLGRRVKSSHYHSRKLRQRKIFSILKQNTHPDLRKKPRRPLLRKKLRKKSGPRQKKFTGYLIVME